MRKFHCSLIITQIVAVINLVRAYGSDRIIIKNNQAYNRIENVVLNRKSFSPVKKGVFPLITSENDKPIFQLVDLNNDGLWDQIILRAEVKAYKSKVYDVIWSKTQRIFPARTNVRFSRRSINSIPTPEILNEHRLRGFNQNIALPYYQLEGPGIENDKVAFRCFFDTRNTKDIYGKITTDMVLSQVGVKSGWHEMQNWGMDIYSSANTLGAGGLAIIQSGRIYGLADADTSFYQFVTKGALKASFKLTFKNWDTGTGKSNGSEYISINQGDYFYTNEFKVQASPDQTVAVGLGKVGIDTFYYKKLNDMYSCIYCYGNQAAGTHNKLGTAIVFKNSDYLFSRNSTPPDPVTNTCIVALKRAGSGKYKIHFFACWEKTNSAFATLDGFQNYLFMAANRLANPLVTKVYKNFK